MELNKYVGRYVKIDLTNNFYYEGIVLSCDEDSLELKDKFGKMISLNVKAILFIRELGK